MIRILRMGTAVALAALTVAAWSDGNMVTPEEANPIGEFEATRIE